MTVLQIPEAGSPHAGDPAADSANDFAEFADRYAALPWPRKLARYLRGERALPQLIRFAVVGTLSNVSYVLLFLGLAAAGPLLANLAGSVVSTVLANEMHRRLTFHATERVGWFTAQWEAGGLALVGLGVTSAALAALEVWTPGMPETVQAAAVLAIIAAVGGLRFLALRGLVFRPLTFTGK